MEIGHFHALGCKLIEVRGFDCFRAKAAKVGVALIIGEDDDEIGVTGDSRNRAES